MPQPDDDERFIQSAYWYLYDMWYVATIYAGKCYGVAIDLFRWE